MSRPICRLKVVTGHATALRTSACGSESEDDVDLDSLAYGFMASQALFAALELGVFDHLAKGPQSVSDLAAGCGVPCNRLQTLLTALVAAKCLRRDGSQLYSNSPNVQKFMVSASKAYYGDYFKHQVGGLFYARMGQLAKVLRGEEVLDYSQWFSDPTVASLYTSAQHNGSLATAKSLFRKVSLATTGQMLDVGGGSGAFSLQAARMNPELRATVLDFPEVCRVGRSLMEQAAPEKPRVSFKELDATSPSWPVEAESQDLVLMSYLCGSVPEDLIAQLFQNAFRVLRAGGRLVVHDFMVDDTRDGPALGAYWALQHVTVNPTGFRLAAAPRARRCQGGSIRRATLDEFSGHVGERQGDLRGASPSFVLTFTRLLLGCLGLPGHGRQGARPCREPSLVTLQTAASEEIFYPNLPTSLLYQFREDRSLRST
eukprot:s5389_g5.t1